MTAHPIDTEDLRREMEDLAGDALARDSRWAGTVSPVEALAILDLLAAAEHRATRAEAQSAIRGRAVVIYRERAREAEARIKAAQELHQQSALIRRIPRYMRQGHDDDQPFHYCTGCDGARYPCDTIRALDAATTTQETNE